MYLESFHFFISALDLLEQTREFEYPQVAGSSKLALDHEVRYSISRLVEFCSSARALYLTGSEVLDHDISGYSISHDV